MTRWLESTAFRSFLVLIELAEMAMRVTLGAIALAQSFRFRRPDRPTLQQSRV